MTRRPLKIGLTNFLRFISATGVSKLGAAEKAADGYRDWKDYYLELREVIVPAIAHHDPDRIYRFLEERGTDKKSEQFALLGTAIAQWIKTTKYTFLEVPPLARWDAMGLRISINPEVAIEMDGVEYLIKLYLAQGTVSQPAQRAFAWLVKETHGTHRKPALLYVRTGDFKPSPNPNTRVGRWVRSEAASLLTYINLNNAA